MRKFLVASIFILLCAFPMFAACTFGLNVENDSANHYTLTWDPVMGISKYVIEESSNNFVTVQTIDVAADFEAPSFAITRRTTSPQTIAYRVHAFDPNENGSIINCTSRPVSLVFTADAELSRAVKRAVIPIVGKVDGANDAKFGTSVKLIATAANMKGNLVLRSIGSAGSEADPAIPYELANAGDVMELDDVMAAFGRTGLGSIDIIPEGSEIPLALTHVFNTTAKGEVFGTFEQQIVPWNFYDATTEARPFLFAPSDAFRVNIGVRSLEPATVELTVFDKDKVQLGTKQLNLFADELQFGSAREILGFDLKQGDVVHVAIVSGDAIPFYTFTENTTNDPSLFVLQPKSIDVGGYILP